MAKTEVQELREELELLKGSLKLPAVGAAANPVPLTPAQERRYVLKDILNTNLLSPEARKQFEQEYAENGAALEKAAKAAEK